MPPEDNPADDVQQSKEEYIADMIDRFQRRDYQSGEMTEVPAAFVHDACELAAMFIEQVATPSAVDAKYGVIHTEEPAMRYHDFTRDNGEIVSVKFKLSGGSPATYSPYSGAGGGDAGECEIVEAIVNGEIVELPTEERERYEEWLIGNVEPEEYDPD